MNNTEAQYVQQSEKTFSLDIDPYTINGSNQIKDLVGNDLLSFKKESFAQNHPEYLENISQGVAMLMKVGAADQLLELTRGNLDRLTYPYKSPLDEGNKKCSRWMTLGFMSVVRDYVDLSGEAEIDIYKKEWNDWLHRVPVLGTIHEENVTLSPGDPSKSDHLRNLTKIGLLDRSVFEGNEKYTISEEAVLMLSKEGLDVEKLNIHRRLVPQQKFASRWAEGTKEVLQKHKKGSKKQIKSLDFKSHSQFFSQTHAKHEIKPIVDLLPEPVPTNHQEAKWMISGMLEAGYSEIMRKRNTMMRNNDVDFFTDSDNAKIFYKALQGGIPTQESWAKMEVEQWDRYLDDAESVSQEERYIKTTDSWVSDETLLELGMDRDTFNKVSKEMQRRIGNTEASLLLEKPKFQRYNGRGWFDIPSEEDWGDVVVLKPAAFKIKPPYGDMRYLTVNYDFSKLADFHGISFQEDSMEPSRR